MRRLHRFTTDRKIAGVCAGLGEYFDVDPLAFRLGFLVSLAFGGLGAIAYLVLWVMLPATAQPTRVSAVAARLHLSATDRKLAGVCGGLAEFFGLDPVLFRAAMVVLAFLGGFGILLYLALWLLMRPAPAGASSQDVQAGA